MKSINIITAGIFLLCGNFMSQGVNRQWLLVSRPEGMISESNFRLVESPIPIPKEGEVLIRNLWISFDPTQRGWMSIDTYVPKIPLGEVMRAFAVGKVIESKQPEFKAGELVSGLFGWQDHIATDGSGLVMMRKLPKGTPANLALSLFGITGLSAYFGVNDIAQSGPGETFVVSAAAGAVGSIAGQIAKIKGSRVIGIAGRKKKCDWVVNEAGFNGAIDYQSEDVGARLSELCPKGIDVYFDNVGGPILDEVLARINLHARIVLCGAISRYSTTTNVAYGPRNYFNLTLRRARMEGFLVLDYATRYPEAIEALAKWLAEGRLKQKEDTMIGLENAPKALIRLFTGENFGKQLLKIGDT
jgi:NADPH-dependent curcumin reductase